MQHTATTAKASTLAELSERHVQLHFQAQQLGKLWQRTYAHIGVLVRVCWIKVRLSALDCTARGSCLDHGALPHVLIGSAPSWSWRLSQAPFICCLCCSSSNSVIPCHPYTGQVRMCVPASSQGTTEFGTQGMENYSICQCASSCCAAAWQLRTRLAKAQAGLDRVLKGVEPGPVEGPQRSG